MLNPSGPGWQRDHAISIVNESQYKDTQQSRRTSEVGIAYDVVVHRVNHPWLSKVSPEDLQDSINQATYYLNATVVIFVTGHVTNNVKTIEDWDELRRINTVFREFAKEYNSRNETRTPNEVRHVLIADVERYIETLYRYNAIKLGYNSTDDAEILADKLNPPNLQSPHPRKIVMCCAERVEPGAAGCVQNNLFNDGIHLCMNRIGFRIEAALACLIDCAYNSNNADETIQRCEQACNDRFLSMQPIPDNEIMTV